MLRFEFARDPQHENEARDHHRHLPTAPPNARARAADRRAAARAAARDARAFGARGHASMRDRPNYAFKLAAPPTFSTEVQRLQTNDHDAWLLPLANAAGEPHDNFWLALYRPRTHPAS